MIIKNSNEITQQRKENEKTDMRNRYEIEIDQETLRERYIEQMRKKNYMTEELLDKILSRTVKFTLIDGKVWAVISEQYSIKGIRFVDYSTNEIYIRYLDGMRKFALNRGV